MSPRPSRSRSLLLVTLSVNSKKAVQHLAIAACTFTPVALFAQGTTATLGGTVADKSGAVIPDATVQLKK